MQKKRDSRAVRREPPPKRQLQLNNSTALPWLLLGLRPANSPNTTARPQQQQQQRAGQAAKKKGLSLCVALAEWRQARTQPQSTHTQRCTPARATRPC